MQKLVVANGAPESPSLEEISLAPLSLFRGLFGFFQNSSVSAELQKLRKQLGRNQIEEVKKLFSGFCEIIELSLDAKEPKLRMLGLEICSTLSQAHTKRELGINLLNILRKKDENGFIYESVFLDKFVKSENPQPALITVSEVLGFNSKQSSSPSEIDDIQSAFNMYASSSQALEEVCHAVFSAASRSYAMFIAAPLRQMRRTEIGFIAERLNLLLHDHTFFNAYPNYMGFDRKGDLNLRIPKGFKTPSFPEDLRGLLPSSWLDNCKNISVVGDRLVLALDRPLVIDHNQL